MDQKEPKKGKNSQKEPKKVILLVKIPPLKNVFYAFSILLARPRDLF